MDREDLVTEKSSEMQELFHAGTDMVILGKGSYPLACLLSQWLMGDMADLLQIGSLLLIEEENLNSPTVLKKS